jgi:hypothetical protein
MIKLDFISYYKTLRPEDWNIQVTKMWTVKDVVAHMVGWEKIDPQVIRETWRTRERPWFYNTNDSNEFNRKNVESYRGYSPRRLIAEWEQWQRKVQAEIDRIGENNLRSLPELFHWLFDRKHYSHHFVQIKSVMEKKRT